MRDDVARSVDLHGIVTADFVGAVGADTGPVSAGPPDEQVALFEAPDEDVVGDVEVARSGIFGPDTEPDILEAAVLDRQSDRPQYVLEAGEDGDVGVAKRKPVEDVVSGCADVEEAVVARAIEDDLTVAGGLDRDRLLDRTLDGEPVGAVERRHHRVNIVEALVAVQPGVDEDGVAGLHGALPHDVPVAESGPVVGLQQAAEIRLQLLALVIRGVDVQRLSAGIRLRLSARGDADGLRRLA